MGRSQRYDGARTIGGSENEGAASAGWGVNSAVVECQLACPRQRTDARSAWVEHLEGAVGAAEIIHAVIGIPGAGTDIGAIGLGDDCDDVGGRTLEKHDAALHSCDRAIAARSTGRAGGASGASGASRTGRARRAWGRGEAAA